MSESDVLEKVQAHRIALEAERVEAERVKVEAHREKVRGYGFTTLDMDALNAAHRGHLPKDHPAIPSLVERGWLVPMIAGSDVLTYSAAAEVAKIQTYLGEREGWLTIPEPVAEVEPTPEPEPVREYGWELRGQRLAVGDVVRSGHPRADGSTAVVVSVRERGDGEQMAGLHWDGVPVTYESWSGVLVRVPVAVVERAEPVAERLALPAAPVRLALMAAPEPEFPGKLERGESAEYMGDGVWQVTYREGFTYRLTPCTWSVSEGQYGVGRVLEDGTVSRWGAIFDDTSIAPAVRWTRKESQTLAETHRIQDTYGHLDGGKYGVRPQVRFSLELDVEELEKGKVWRVARFGYQGVLILQTWGYALLGETGDFPETPNRKFKDGKRLRYAIQCVVGGLGDVPTDRMRLVEVDRSGEPCVVNGHDAGQSCESGKRNKAFPRFLVEVTGPDGEIAGTVPICAHCWARRAVGGDTHRVADIAWRLAEGKGSWVDWQDRAEDLTGELIAAALDAGEELPDVKAVLYAEALEIGDGRAATAAKVAARAARTPAKRVKEIGAEVIAGRQQARAELIAWAEEYARAWTEWHRAGWDESYNRIEGYPEFVPPVKPGPSVEVAADDTSYAGEDDDQEQPEPVAADLSHLRGPMRRALERDAAEELCEGCEQYADECDCHDPEAEELEPLEWWELPEEQQVAYLDGLTEEQRQEIAGRWPVRWLYPWREGQPERGLNVCAGCGGGCVGLRTVLGVELDMVCVDTSKDACATAEAAGCTVLRMDVRDIDPRHPALGWTRRATFTMPCPEWSPAGKRLGHLPENLEILCTAMADVAEAYGNVWVSGGHFGDATTAEYGHVADIDVAEMWSWLDGMTGETAGLMLAPVLIGMGLLAAGAPLQSVIIEQSAALPEVVKGAIGIEYVVAGWDGVQWDVLDAGQFGSPSTRKRAIMLASRSAVQPVEAPGITTRACDVLGWGEAARILTRNNRKSGGGNATRLDKTMTGITSKIRGWYCEETGRRFTIEEVCALVGLPRDYPLTGSRTSQCQQAGDILSPLVAAALWGTLLGLPWLELLRTYLSLQFPTVHGLAGESMDVGTEPEPLEMWEGEGGAVPGVETPEPPKVSLRERLRAEIAEKDKHVQPGAFAALMEANYGPNWRGGDTFEGLDAMLHPEHEDQEEEQAPVQGIAPITREQRRAAYRLAAGEPAPGPRFAGGDIVSVGGRRGHVRSVDPLKKVPTALLVWEDGAGTMHVPYADIDPVTAPAVDPEEAECWAQLAEERDQQERPAAVDARCEWMNYPQPEPELRGWFAAKVAPEPVAEVDGPDYAAVSAERREQAALYAELFEELEQQAEAEELDAPSMTWGEVSSALDELWLELRAQQAETTPSPTWEELTRELSALGSEVRQAEPVPVALVRIPRTLRRDLMTIAAAGALVTLTASNVAEVVPVG
ncbi:hypothetical protein ABZW02_20290 [Streptomyces sp. NPDC005180]|uniref:hypothetical protein n=1 Tax=Streptomyces sp. NPDC005180 TaxID=3156868 RepID=UPI0033A5EDE7